MAHGAASALHDGTMTAPVNAPVPTEHGPALDLNSSEPLLRRLELTVRNRLDGLLQGNYIGLVPGPGSEAGESRMYTPGDDVRRMDWPVTARTTVPHVRQTIADRELETWMVVDLSPSMDFGTALSEKRELVLAAITAIVHLTVRGGNRVGAVVSNGTDSYRIPALGGRNHARYLMRRVAATSRAERSGRTGSRRDAGIAAAATAAPRAGRRRSRTSWIRRRPASPRPGSARCAPWASAISCSVSRSSTRASSSCRRPGWSPSSTPRPDVSSRCRPRPRACGATTLPRLRRSAPASPRGLRHAGAAHLQLRTDRDWITDVVRFVSARRRAARRSERAARAALMHFLSPAWLLLLILVAVMLVGYLALQLRRRKYVARFSNVALLGSVAPRRPGWRRHLTFALLLIGLTVLSVGVARPSAAVKVPRDRATVMLDIDVSLSMEATDVLPSRLQAAKRAGKEFATLLPARINLGLISFARNANVLVPPTVDRDAVKKAIDGLELANYTAIGEAIFSSLQAIHVFSQATTAKGDKAPPARIVLLSDGSNTFGRSVASAIAAARAAHVQVSTIAFGTPNGTVRGDNGESVPVPADDQTLSEIASQTGGSFHTATSVQELESVYKDIGSQIGYTTEQRDISWRFLATGLLITLVAAGLSMLWSTRFV